MEKWIFKPKGNRVIIRPIKQEEEKKVGSIVLHESMDHLQLGKVIVAGPGEYAPATGAFVPVDVKEDELVLYRKEAPCIPLLNGDLLMREGDIESVVVENIEE